MSWECTSCGFTNNDDTFENCMCGYANPKYPTTATRTVEGDSIVIISHKYSRYWAALVLIVALTIYALLGAVIPVISTGEFNAVLPTDTRTSRNAMIFFCSLLWLAGLPAIFRGISSMGEFCFYKDKLEIRTFLFHRLKVYNYLDIMVNQHGSYRVTIHQRNLPGWKSPFKRLKAVYIDGAGFVISPAGYKDPSKLPLVLSILKEATEYREKAL